MKLKDKIQFYEDIQALDKTTLRNTLEQIYIPSDPYRDPELCPSHQAQRLYFLDAELNVYGYFDHFYFRLIHPKVLARHHITLKYNLDTTKYEIWKQNELIYSTFCLLRSHVMFYAFPKRWEIFRPYFRYRKLMSRIRNKIQENKKNRKVQEI